MKKSLVGLGVLLIVLLSLLAAIIPQDNSIPSTTNTPNDDLITIILEGNSGEIKLTEDDITYLIKNYVDNNINSNKFKIDKLSAEILYSSINIKTILRTQKTYVDIPIYTTINIAPSCKDNVVYITLKSAKIGYIPVPRSIVSNLIKQYLPQTDNIGIDNHTLFIDTKESLITIGHVELDGKNLIIRLGSNIEALITPLKRIFTNNIVEAIVKDTEIPSGKALAKEVSVLLKKDPSQISDADIAKVYNSFTKLNKPAQIELITTIYTHIGNDNLMELQRIYASYLRS